METIREINIMKMDVVVLTPKRREQEVKHGEIIHTF